MSTLAFVPVKNAATWLPAFLPQLEKLEDLGQIIFSYGESVDPTLNFLKEYKKISKHEVRVKPDPQMGKVLTSAQIGGLYRDFQNYIVKHPDEYPESHIALLDADVMRMPDNLFSLLNRHDKDVIAPYIWTLWHDSPCPMFYDSMVFRKDGYRFHPYRPPLNEGKPLQLDSVGTTFIVKKEVFLDVPYGDPYPHMKFCNDAREKGYEVWADPKIAIYHVDLIRFGSFHEEIEVIKARLAGDPDPYRYSDQTPFITDSGKIVSRGELGLQYSKLYTLGALE